MNALRGAGVAIALLGVGLLLRGELVVHATSEDASNLYTDHLRHMGEAAVLVDQGLDVYRVPYGGLITREAGVGAEHQVLFPERTAPYPPIGILTHWPWMQLERSDVLSPVTAHRAVVWMWLAVALLGVVAVTRLFEPLPPIAQAWAAALAIPLLIGMGVNGFFDCAYLLAGVAGLIFWRRGQPAIALACLAAAAAMHFRAAVFAPVAAVILFEQRRCFVRLLPSFVLVVPTLVAAAALSGTLNTIPADNPVHYTHFKLALTLLIVLSAATTLWLTREGEPLVAATVATAFVLAILEHSHGWWHAGTLLAPGLVLAARPARVGWFWPVLWVWTVASAYLAFRHPLSPFWEWVRFALIAQ